MEKKCVVGSLSEYIAAIEKYDLFNCISRGESQLYEHPLRSGIHRTNLDKYSELLEQYHHDVENAIDHIQDKNFLAFAQHHGLPTNLLDFSFSPLVSLYFSMDGCRDKGYVYFVNKNRIVSINKIICEKPLGWGMLKDLLDFDFRLSEVILPQMSESFMMNREEMVEYFESHAEKLIAEFRKKRAKSLLERIKGGVDEFEKSLIKYKLDKVKWEADNRIHEEVTLQIYDSVHNFLSSMRKIYVDDITYPSIFFENHYKVISSSLASIDYAANIEVMLFLLKMEEIEYCYQSASEKNLNFELEFPFYFTYYPPIIDERVKNQSSVFIFQPFIEKAFHYNGKPIQIWQKIVPDFTIEIENPEDIKKELDAIGFNLKHIYCDYDSIAKYIVNSNR